MIAVGIEISDSGGKWEITDRNNGRSGETAPAVADTNGYKILLVSGNSEILIAVVIKISDGNAIESKTTEILARVRP